MSKWIILNMFCVLFNLFYWNIWIKTFWGLKHLMSFACLNNSVCEIVWFANWISFTQSWNLCIFFYPKLGRDQRAVGNEQKKGQKKFQIKNHGRVVTLNSIMQIQHSISIQQSQPWQTPLLETAAAANPKQKKETLNCRCRTWVQLNENWFI